MALCKAEAIVLRTYNYSESSKIVSLYTNRYGKCKVVAKGARRPKSVLRGSLEPITHVSVVFYKKDGRELHTLSQCEAVTSFYELQSDIERYSYANAFCELTDRLTPIEEKNTGLFSLVLETLRMVKQVENGELRMLFWFFQVRLLSLLGFQPDMDTCAGCNTYLSGKTYGFLVPRGAPVCRECTGDEEEVHALSPETRAVLGRLQRTRIEHITRMKISPQAAAQIDNLLQAYLKYHTDDFRDIKSLKVLNAINSRLYRKSE